VSGKRRSTEFIISLFLELINHMDFPGRNAEWSRCWVVGDIEVNV
jgi:hypothetical protein